MLKAILVLYFEGGKLSMLKEEYEVRWMDILANLSAAVTAYHDCFGMTVSLQ